MKHVRLLLLLVPQLAVAQMSAGNLQQINLSGMTDGPAAAGRPSPFVYGNQAHVLYADASGRIWDSWYDGIWKLQQINLGGRTTGPATAGAPVGLVYNGQVHVVYSDASGRIWDAWYDGSWKLQPINLSGLTAGVAASGRPAPFVFDGQFHVVYADRSGNVWDSAYDGKWSLQQVNLGASTTNGDPSPFVYGNQVHVLYRDRVGRIWDSFYDKETVRWTLQQINGGVTAGPEAVGQPVPFVYRNQAHVLYQDKKGAIWDSWYDKGWNLQQINLGGVTDGPAALGLLAPLVHNDQAHVLYTDSGGRIWDSWYDGPTGRWQTRRINVDGLTNGPAAASDPVPFDYRRQTHVLYLDRSGKVWDSWYEGPALSANRPNSLAVQSATSKASSTSCEPSAVAGKHGTLNRYRVAFNGDGRGNGISHSIWVDFRLFDDGRIDAPLTYDNDSKEAFCGGVHVRLEDSRGTKLADFYSNPFQCVGGRPLISLGGGNIVERHPWTVHVSSTVACRYAGLFIEPNTDQTTGSVVEHVVGPGMRVTFRSCGYAAPLLTVACTNGSGIKNEQLLGTDDTSPFSCAVKLSKACREVGYRVQQQGATASIFGTGIRVDARGPVFDAEDF